MGVWFGTRRAQLVRAIGSVAVAHWKVSHHEFLGDTVLIISRRSISFFSVGLNTVVLMSDFKGF